MPSPSRASTLPAPHRIRTVATASTWPATIYHAAINGIAGMGLPFAGIESSLVLGPAPTGLVASLPWAALAVWLLLDPERFRSRLPG